MEKPNLVPSSVIFLFLQQHFLFFFFFFKFSTENASSVSRLGRLEKGKQSFSDSGNFVGGDNGGGCSGGAQVGREFFSLVVGWVVFSPCPPEEERQKEKTKRRDPHSSVFSDAAVDEILSDCCRSSRGRGGAFISLPSWTPWTSATPSTWTRTGNKTFIVSLKQSRLFRSQRVQIQFCFIG